jgi:MYXO-CTERM domain-containing protein
MKGFCLSSALALVLIVVAQPSHALAGLTIDDGAVPEPTAMLVWMGLAGAGGLFFWRRNRSDQ